MKFIIIYTITIFTLLWNFGHSIHNHKDSEDQLFGYDCQDHDVTSTEYSLSEISDCELESTNLTTRTLNIQIVEKKDLFKIHYVQCLISALTTVTRCGKSWQQITPLSTFTDTIVISSDECYNIIKNKRYIYLGKHTVAISQLNQVYKYTLTIQGEASPYGDCVSGGTYSARGITIDRAVAITELTILVKEGDALVETSTNDLILPSGVKCKYIDQECFDHIGGQTFWEIYKSESPCLTHQYSVIYEGPSSLIIDIDNDYLKTYFVQTENLEFSLSSSRESRRGHHLLGFN